MYCWTCSRPEYTGRWNTACWTLSNDEWINQSINLTNYDCVSDIWLMLNQQFVSYLMARTRYIKWNDDDDVCFNWIFTVLAHSNNSPWADMSLHSDTLSWFRANPSLLLLLLSGEAWNTHFIVLGFICPELDPTIYRTGDEYTNHYTTDAVKLWLTIAVNFRNGNH